MSIGYILVDRSKTHNADDFILFFIQYIHIMSHMYISMYRISQSCRIQHQQSHVFQARLCCYMCFFFIGHSFFIPTRFVHSDVLIFLKTSDR